MHHLLAVVAIAAACGGGQRPRTGGAVDAGATVAGDGGTAAVTAGDPITRPECEHLIGHILEVGIAEQRKTKPEAEWSTPDEIEQARQAMVADPKLLEQCLAWDRAVTTCVMAAADTAGLEACLGA